MDAKAIDNASRAGGSASAGVPFVELLPEFGRVRTWPQLIVTALRYRQPMRTQDFYAIGRAVGPGFRNRPSCAAAVTDMYRGGRLDRVGRGLYALPADGPLEAQEPALTKPLGRTQND